MMKQLLGQTFLVNVTLISQDTKYPGTYWPGRNALGEEVDHEWSAGISHELATQILDVGAKAYTRGRRDSLSHSL